MFILEGSNNETDNALSAAHFELGTGEECHGAVVIKGIENASTLTLPHPQKAIALEDCDATETEVLRQEFK